MFTARYELTPYIKQITFRSLKGEYSLELGEQAALLVMHSEWICFESWQDAGCLDIFAMIFRQFSRHFPSQQVHQVGNAALQFVSNL